MNPPSPKAGGVAHSLHRRTRSLCAAFCSLLLAACLLAQQQGDSQLQQLIEQRRQELARNPDNLTAVVELAQLLATAGDQSESRALARRAYEVLQDKRQSDDATAAELRDLGLAAELLNKTGEAIAILSEALQRDPQSLLTVYSLARIQSQRGESQAAIELLKDTLAQRPNEIPLRELLAQVYLEASQPGEAAEVYQELLSQQPGNPRYAASLLSSYAAAKDLPKAKAFLQQLVDSGAISELDRHLHVARIALSNHDLGESRKAIREIRRIEAEHPAVDSLNASLYAAQARQAEEEGEPAKALIFWNRVLGIDPSNRAALFEAARLYAFSGDFKKAQEYFDKLLQSPPDLPEFYVYLAYNLFALGRGEAALQTLELSARIASESNDQAAVALYQKAKDRIRSTEDPTTIFEELDAAE